MTGAVLITGANGFVGRAIMTRLLANNSAVIALTRRHVDDLPAGVIQRIAPPVESLDHEDWLAALDGAATVIHAAGIAHIGADVPEKRYDEVNHRATAALAVAARQAGIRRIVFFSSIRAQAGASAPDVLTENTPPAPDDAYGRSKLAAERALAASGVEHVILRPVVIVGPQARGNIANLVRLARLPLPLPLGALTAQRSLVSLDHVAEVAMAALSAPEMAGGTYILADPETLSVGEMVAAIRHGMGRKAGLFPLPEALLALPFRLTGQMALWQRFAAPQVARSLRLRVPGSDGRGCARAALHALGRAMPARG